ncbi:hypothetical protein BH20BAC1_BH20BAC1_14070 [soil metagenome]
MNHSQEILNELKGISPLLAGLEKKNVFQVPSGYFESLPENILQNTLAEEVQLSSTFSKNETLEVPAGYFDSLSDNILMKIRELYPESALDEIEKISPLLAKLQNINVFHVPFGYFKTVAGSIVKNVRPAAGKIVAMKPRKTWFHVAAAAVVAGIIAVSSLQLFKNTTPEKQISAVIVSENDFSFATSKQINEGIASLSADEIVKYLEKNGNIMDNDLLITNTDVSEMPDETDYLKNENTLNLYLDKIDSQINSN